MGNTINTIIHNLETLGGILQAIAIGIGVGLVLSGFFKLMRYGQMRSFMSQQMSLMGPMALIVSGVFMLSIPTTIHLFLSTVWTNTNPIRYQSSGASWDEIFVAIKMFVRVLGVIAIMRGILLLSRLGSQGQPGTAGKAGMYIFGGILSVHIQGTIDIIKSFYGYA